MKILYVCPHIPSKGINAGSSRMFELIKRIAVKNDVSVISFIRQEETRFLTELRKICKRVDVIEKDYPWIPDALSILPPMVEEFSYYPMRRLVSDRLEEDFDILHFEYLVMAQYAPARYKAVKFLTVHELYFLAQLRDLRLKRGIWNKMKTWGSMAKKKVYEINICRRFNKVITMTDTESDVLCSYSPLIDAEPVAMGVDHRFFCPQNEAKEDIDIIFVGFFRHHPNVDAVLYFYNKIFPCIRKREPQVKFTIIGHSLPDSIIALERDDNIRVTGYVKDIRPYLARSKVFIMPIRLGYGMRGKLFEAWGMSRAVVSTSIGCDGIKVMNEENILIANEPEDFAQKVIDLMHDAKKRKCLGQKGRELVEKEYNWDVLADRLEGMYIETLRKIA